MAQLDIIIAPDPRLKEKAKPVASVDAGVRKLMADMLETMYAAPGIGLAAPQVGVLKRVIVLDAAREGHTPEPYKMANPELTWVSDDDIVYNEGCLSLPDHYADVARPAAIKVRYLDEQNEIRELHAEGVLAVCIQHEMDHLDGILFVDHISALKRNMILRKLLKSKKTGSVGARQGARALGTSSPSLNVRAQPLAVITDPSSGSAHTIPASPGVRAIASRWPKNARSTPSRRYPRRRRGRLLAAHRRGRGRHARCPQGAPARTHRSQSRAPSRTHRQDHRRRCADRVRERRGRCTLRRRYAAWHGRTQRGCRAGQRIEFRIGINVGDIVIDGDDILGDGVNIAARLEGLAEPGGVLVSRAVRDQVRDRLEAPSRIWASASSRTSRDRCASIGSRVPAESKAASTRARPLPLPDKPSIAVLPFANMSGDAEQEYFADGIAEDIITGLSRLRWLFVIARNSSFTYKGRNVDVRQVGRELGVRYVLEGSVRKGGNRVRITGQLVEAETGNHLWAERYDRALDDVFAIQDEITDSVIGCIQPELYAAEHDRVKRKPPQNLDAWESFVRGMFLYSQHSDKAPRKPLTCSPVPLSWTTTTRKPMACARSALHGARFRVGRIEIRPLRKSLKGPIARSRAIPRNPGLILRMALSLWRSGVIPMLSVRSAEPSMRVPTLPMRMVFLGAAHSAGGRPDASHRVHRSWRTTKSPRYLWR